MNRFCILMYTLDQNLEQPCFQTTVSVHAHAAAKTTELLNAMLC